MTTRRVRRVGTSFLVSAILLIGSGCGKGSSPDVDPATGRPIAPADPISSILDVLSIDSELGAARNQATRSASLAEAVRDYVAALDSIDFSGCPDDFTVAFRYHRDAWAESIPFFEPFAELRGEMHDLFEDIRGRDVETRDRLERVEVRIWDSWREVEAVAADYGAIEPPSAE